MDRGACIVGVDLVEDVGELQVEFVFGDIADMGCRQDVFVGEQDVAGRRFFFINIDRRISPSPGEWLHCAIEPTAGQANTTRFLGSGIKK